MTVLSSRDVRYLARSPAHKQVCVHTFLFSFRLVPRRHYRHQPPATCLASTLQSPRVSRFPFFSFPLLFFYFFTLADLVSLPTDYELPLRKKIHANVDVLRERRETRFCQVCLLQTRFILKILAWMQMNLWCYDWLVVFIFMLLLVKLILRQCSQSG